MHERAFESFIKKADWANSVKAGDVLSIIKPPPGRAHMWTLWPEESFPWLNLEDDLHRLKGGDCGIATGRTKFGLVPSAVLKQIWYFWMGLPFPKKKEMEHRINKAFGLDSFIGGHYHNFSIRLPFLQIVPMGFSGIGYVPYYIATPTKNMR